MVGIMDVAAVLSPFWSLSRVHEVNNAMLSGVGSTGSGCRVLCVLLLSLFRSEHAETALPMSFSTASLETQYINYISRYRSIFLTEWCVSITTTELLRLAGMLWML